MTRNYYFFFLHKCGKLGIINFILRSETKGKYEKIYLENLTLLFIKVLKKLMIKKKKIQ